MRLFRPSERKPPARVGAVGDAHARDERLSLLLDHLRTREGVTRSGASATPTAARRPPQPFSAARPAVARRQGERSPPLGLALPGPRLTSLPDEAQRPWLRAHADGRVAGLWVH